MSFGEFGQFLDQFRDLLQVFERPGEPRALEEALQVDVGTDPAATNSWDEPGRVAPTPFSLSAVDGSVEAELPPLSLVVASVTLAAA